MAYYVSYILNDDGKRKKNKLGITMPNGLYHASIAITEHNPPDPPQILTKIGLFNSSQVEMEDFLKPKEGRKFYHKTYPISQDEMVKLMQKINTDRVIGIEKVQGNYPADNSLPEKSLNDDDKRGAELVMQKQKKQVVTDDHGKKEAVMVPHFMESKPGGPEYSFFRLNCKTYAMSLLNTVGIHDKDLKDWLIDDPGTGLNKLELMEFKEKPAYRGDEKKMIWESPMKVSPRLKHSQVHSMSEQDTKDMLLSIQYNNFKGFILDASNALNLAREEQLEGLDNIIINFKDIAEEIHQFEKDVVAYKRDLNMAIQMKPDLQMEDAQEILSDNELINFINYRQQHNLNSKNVAGDLISFTEERSKNLLKIRLDKWINDSNIAVESLGKSLEFKGYTTKHYIVDSLKTALNYISSILTLKSKLDISKEYGEKQILGQFKTYGKKLTQQKEKLRGTANKAKKK